MSKQLVASLADGRLSPSEELANRRKIRLIQVRQQEQEIAKRVRKQVQQQKRNILQDVAQKLNKEFENKKNMNYAISKEKYVEGLAEFGKAHENATSEVADQALIAAIFDQQKRDAHKRYTEAVQRAKMLKAIEEENERAVIERRMLVKKKESIRAKQIALLPKKEVSKDDESGEYSANTTIFSNKTQSALVERSYAQDVNAKEAAAEEESRCADLDKDRICDHSAQMERAQLRHLAALEKARMTKEYSKLESDVKVLQRKAAFSKRNHFSTYPGQGAEKFGNVTQAELLETLGIPQAWELDVSNANEEEVEEDGSSSNHQIADQVDELGSSVVETEGTTSTSRSQSEEESSEFTSGLATSESEESGARLTFVPGRGLPSYNMPARKPYSMHDGAHRYHEDEQRSGAELQIKPKHKKKKAVAFQIPMEEVEEKTIDEDLKPKSYSSDDDSGSDVHEELTKPSGMDSTGDEISKVLTDEPVKDVKGKEDVVLPVPEKLEKDAKTTPPTSPPPVSHADVKRALQQPDVLAFQRRILEAHGFSGSEKSANSSLQDADEPSSQSTTSDVSESEVSKSDEATSSSDSAGTSANESVVSLEDGLDKIALGIEKREDELKRQQDILEEYKRKLIAQQKQHAAIAKLSATVGRQLNRPPVSPEIQAMIEKESATNSASVTGSSINVIDMSDKGSPETNRQTQGMQLNASNLQIPSLLMMTDPNVKLPTPVSSFTSEHSTSNAAVVGDDSDMMEVHEISSDSLIAPSSASKISSISKIPSTQPSIQEGLSFVELAPQADVHQVETGSSQSSTDYSFDTHQFVELPPDMATPAKIPLHASDFNPNISSFVELTPETPEVDVKDVTSIETPSNLDISEHPLSPHDSNEMLSYPPLSSIEDVGSVRIRSPPDSHEDGSDTVLNETSWKTLLAQTDTTADSSSSAEESSIETMRMDDTVIELAGHGILEEPDMTLVSLNSSIPENNSLISEKFMEERVEISSTALNRSAVVKEKIPTPDSSIVEKMAVPSQPATSDECLAKLFAYLKEIDSTK